MNKRSAMLCITFLFMLMVSAALGEAVSWPQDSDGNNIPITNMAPFQDRVAAWSNSTNTLLVGGESYHMELDQSGFEEELAAFIQRLCADEQQSGWVHYTLVAGNNALYLLGKSTGELYCIDIDGDRAVGRAVGLCDLLPDGPVKSWPTVASAAIVGNDLFVLVYRYDFDDGTIIGSSLYAFDLTTYQRREIEGGPSKGSTSIMRKMLVAGDGRLLLCYDVDGEEWAVFYTPESNTFQPLGEAWPKLALPSDADIILCDARNQQLVYRDGNLLYAADDAGNCYPVVHANSYTFQPLLLPDGMLLMIDNFDSSIRMVDLTQPMSVTPLIVYSDYSNVGDTMAFEKENPDIEIKLLTPENTNRQTASKTYANTITTHAATPDVIVLPIGTLTQSILEKGFAVPLDGDAANHLLSVLYDHVASQLTDQDGRLAMVPCEINRYYGLSYNATAATSLGIGEEEMPATYGELIEFLHDWENDYGDRAEEMGISIFDSRVRLSIGKLKSMLYRDLVALSQEDPSVAEENAAEIGALFDALTSLGQQISDRVEPPSLSREDSEYSSGDVPEEKADGTYLFSLELSALPSSRVEEGPYRYWMNQHPIELAVVQGEKPVAIYRGSVMMINPYSQHMDEAQRYMNFVMTHMRDDLAANIRTDISKVTLPPVMEQYVQWKEALEQHQREAKNLSGKELRQAEERIALDQSYVSKFEPYIYSLNETQLSEYARSVEMTRAVWLNMDTYLDACSSVWEQYLAGKVDSMQLIRKILSTSSMVHAE